MVPQIQQGEPVKLFKTTEPSRFADGEQKRDFIYVKDAVRMACAFLDHEGGGLYNIGSGKASTWNELALAVYRALGTAPRIEYIDMPPQLVNKYQNYSRAEMGRTKEALKELSSCMTLEDSVADYVRNYLVPGTLW
jgi:ADP-L-glycero-D-manno-heptose 6-epimerase